jgi:uncharacterized membrane protein
MSNLIVATFRDEYKADQALISMVQLESKDLIDLEDAVVAIKTKRGRIHVKQTMDLTTGGGAVAGGWWGMLIGLLLGGPAGGVVGGMAVGALLGRLVDLGVDDRFVKDVGKTLQPGSSAIFVLVRAGDPDKLTHEIERFGGQILTAHLSPEAQTWLMKTAQAGDDSRDGNQPKA